MNQRFQCDYIYDYRQPYVRKCKLQLYYIFKTNTNVTIWKKMGASMLNFERFIVKLTITITHSWDPKVAIAFDSSVVIKSATI